MPRFFRCALLSIAVVMSVSSTADAQNHEFQVWNSVTLQSAFKKDSKWVGWTDIHARRGSDQTTLILRPGFGLKLMDCLTVHIGYAWVPTFRDGATRNEHRLWQHALWTPRFGKPANLLVRMRLEQRWMKGGDHAGHRLRWMARAHWTPPSVDSLLLVAWDEVFVQLNDTNWNLNRGYDQNRIFAGLGFRTPIRLRFEVGYLFVHLKRAPENQMQHALAINIFY